MLNILAADKLDGRSRRYSGLLEIYPSQISIVNLEVPFGLQEVRAHVYKGGKCVTQGRNANGLDSYLIVD